MQFSTRDACCTLSCGRTVKPLFYRLHELETVGLWVWFPFMICLGWWAGTTGPPRIPPSQGCEHLCVMSFIPKSSKSKSATIQKCNVPKEDDKILWENEANFIEVLVVFGSGISNKKDLILVLHWYRTEVFHSACGSFDWFVNTMLNSWSWRNDLKQCYL